ncbi:MAG: hypothetical protein QHH12_01120 [Candidatus Bathyarchaeota archaeon]|nr:hypothetical protein [Candidatus Bathyarchaeota archaeon A05DMB-3]MDH7606357.1 hypothetical protein [Candidatus Bathyarchaeota archaeon]
MVKKQDVGDDYLLVGEVKIGVLRHFVKLGRLLFPRYFFYAVFSTTLYLIYLLLFMQSLTQETVFITVFGAIVLAIFWMKQHAYGL